MRWRFRLRDAAKRWRSRSEASIVGAPQAMVRVALNGLDIHGALPCARHLAAYRAGHARAAARFRWRSPAARFRGIWALWHRAGGVASARHLWRALTARLNSAAGGAGGARLAGADKHHASGARIRQLGAFLRLHCCRDGFMTTCPSNTSPYFHSMFSPSNGSLLPRPLHEMSFRVTLSASQAWCSFTASSQYKRRAAVGRRACRRRGITPPYAGWRGGGYRVNGVWRGAADVLLSK